MRQKISPLVSQQPLKRNLLTASIACFLLLITLAAHAATPTGLIAEAHDQRVDLVWNRISQNDSDRFNIYRAPQPTGPWQKLNATPHTIHIYSDFVGANNTPYHYRVTLLEGERFNPQESAPSTHATAMPRAMNDEAFLTSMQKACFRYFWDFGHPVSGLAREGFKHRRDTVTTGGTGFGMINIVIGAERGFVTRTQAATRLLKMVTFLQEKATRFHGLWSHHLNGATGQTQPFAGKDDNGGDIVESAFLIQGMITAREYFDQNNPTENELRQRVTQLWREAEWSWYLQPGDKKLTWHWSPDFGFQKNHKFGGFNECMIAYLLAMASPTYPIPADCYYLGWASNIKRYVNNQTYYNIQQPVGQPLGGPLFFTHYSYLVLDPHQLTDAYTNYFDNNRAISRIQQRYAIANPHNYKGYSKHVWGFTASQNPRGYKAHRPVISLPKNATPKTKGDDGTITPTAALSAFPYTPAESLATLKHFYYQMGPEIWGAFGFFDAFNLTDDWVSPSFLAIDQGTIAPMIENHRTALPWKIFMKSDVATAILKKLDEAKSAALQP